jgi:hypothetical protein
MVAESIDRDPAHLRIFTRDIVASNHPLNFIAQRFVQSTLTSDRSSARSLGTATRLKNFTAAA